MEPVALSKVVADLINFLLAPLGFDVLGCQWGQFRNRPTDCAKQIACNEKLPAPTHKRDPATGQPAPMSDYLQAWVV